MAKTLAKNIKPTHPSAPGQTVAVQPKLKVSTPGDRYEREADAMAGQVMQYSESGPETAAPVTGLIARSLQSATGMGGSSYGLMASPGLVSQLQGTTGHGRPLSTETRAFMEHAFSADFSCVRVHTDSQAATMSRSIRAEAFTYGKDIYFDTGTFRPEASEGKRLLAHELAHVVQQQQIGPALQRKSNTSIPAGAGYEGTVLYWNTKGAGTADAQPVTESALQEWLFHLITAGLDFKDVLKQIETSDEFVGASEGRQVWVAFLEKAWINKTNVNHAVFPVTDDEIKEGNGSPNEFILNNLLPETVTAKGTASKPLDTAPEPVGQSLVSGASQTSAPVKETEEADNLQEVPYKEAPQKPRDDRQYLSIEQRIKSVAKKEKEILIPAEAKRDEIPKASVLPVAKEKKRRAYRKHNQEISGVKKEDTPYTVEGFLADFKKSVEEGLKKKNQLLDNYNGDIGINESQSRKSLKEYDETQGAAKLKKITGTPVDGFHDSAGEDFSEPVAVQTEQVGKQPHVSAPERAVPKPTTPQQISLEPFSQALDEPFAKKEVKESWLANSDNDEYKAAYQKKVTAQTNLANIPVEFKTKTEAPTLVDSKSSAAQDINSATKSSHQLRTETLGTASKTQAEAVGTIKKGKEADYSAFEAIFEETNTKVKTALASIRDVQSSFEAILQDAKTEFKKEADKFQGYLYPSFYVVRRTWPDSENPVREKAQKGFVAEGNRLYPDNPFQAIAYAKERSSEYIYGRLKEQYATKVMFEMQVLAIFIVGKLNEARTAIKEGERKAKEANEKLPNADEQSNKAYETIKTRFTNLRESVDGQRSMLLQGMSQAYIETEGQLRGIYDKAHAEAQKTWLDDVVEFVEEIVDAIAEFAGQIRQLLGSVIHLLDYIVTHPIRFFEDLSAGIREGFSGFVEKIDVHLATAFLDWLRGNNQKSSNPIEIPEQFDGMGLFSLFTQLLRLNRETLWERVELKFGKKVTDFLRKGVGLAEKGLEIFSIYREKGLGGLWDYVKGSLDSMVGGMLTQLQETVVFELVKKAIAKIALLFVPGGGFVAIAKMIIDALSFLYHNRNSILQLIEMFISTLEYAAIGNIEKIVELVVSGLTRFMTLSIDFLARIFNLGNLNDMVQRVLETIRNPIIRAIDFVLDQLKKIIDKLFGTGQEAEKPQEGDLADSEVGEPLEFSADGEPHRLWISTAGQGVETMMRSEEISVDKQLGNMAKETNDLPEASQSEAKSLLSIAKQQNKSVEKEGAETKKEMAEAGKNPEPQEVQQAEKADEETVAAEEALKNTLIKLLELFENIFAIADKFKSEIHRLHPEVAEHILNAVEKQPDKYEDMEAWDKVESSLISDVVQEEYKRPINLGHNYGKFVSKNQVKPALDAAISQSNKPKEEALKGDNEDDFINARRGILHNDSTSGTPKQVLTTLRNQIFNNTISDLAISNLTAFFLNSISGKSDHDRFRPTNVKETITSEGGKRISYYYADGKEQFEVFLNKDNYPTRVVGENLNLHNFGRGVTEEAIGKIKGAQQDSAHLIANMFSGTGFNTRLDGVKVSLNLIATSDRFNRVTMRDQENEIRDFVLSFNIGLDVESFNMDIDVTWATENDSIETTKIFEEIMKLADEDQRRLLLDGEEQELRRLIETNLAKTSQPRVMNVEYAIVLTLVSGEKKIMKPAPETGPDLLFGLT